VFLTELFLAQRTKFRRFYLILLRWLAKRANGRVDSFIGPLSCLSVDVVVALMADGNQGDDVLIVEEHVLIGVSIVYGLVDELQALLIDEGPVVESDVIALEAVTALDAGSE
jgi:hypothetical protein